MPRPLPADAPAPAPLPGMQLGQPPTILVLDDSEFDRRRLARLLDRTCPGAEVIEAATPAEFETALRHHPVDIVFIDYLLAGWTGLAALDRMAAQPRLGEPTAIMLAGQGDMSVALQAMRRGCADYLEKATLSEETLADALAIGLARRMLTTAQDTRRLLTTMLQATALRLAAASASEVRSKAQDAIARIDAARSDGTTARAALEHASCLLSEIVGLCGDLDRRTARGAPRPARLI